MPDSGSDTDGPIKTSTCRVHYSPCDDQYLVDTLLKYQGKYYHEQALEWKGDVWHLCLLVLRSKGSKSTLRKGLREDKLRDHFQKKLIKDLYVVLKMLSSDLYNFTWDREERRIKGDETAWEAYLKKEPHHKHFRRRQIIIFDSMMKLCTTTDPVTGDHKFRARMGNEILHVVLPAAKYEPPSMTSSRPSRWSRDFQNQRRSSRSVSPRRRRSRSRSYDYPSKGECDELFRLYEIDDGPIAGPSRDKGKDRDPAERGACPQRPFLKCEPPPEQTIAEIMQNSFDTFGKQLLTAIGTSIGSSDAQVEKQSSAIRLLEQDLASSAMSEVSFFAAARYLTEHKDIAVTYATMNNPVLRRPYLKGEMEKNRHHLIN